MRREDRDIAGDAASLSQRLAQIAGSAESLADDLGCLGVYDGARDPAVLATGKRLAVLARDLSHVVADYFTSLQSPLDAKVPGLDAEDLRDAAALEMRDVQHTQAAILPAVRSALDTAELVVRAQQLHMLIVRRGTA